MILPIHLWKSIIFVVLIMMSSIGVCKSLVARALVSTTTRIVPPSSLDLGPRRFALLSALAKPTDSYGLTNSASARQSLLLVENPNAKYPSKAFSTATAEADRNSRFANLSLSPESHRSLQEVFKYDDMTSVQAETLPLILSGEDCLAKAKTGTGKTLAFLLPTVERIAAALAADTGKTRHRRGDINALVISPARELALQIATEAESLIKFHKNINVMSCVGGTSVGKDVTALNRDSIQIVVATPGRLIDLLENHGLVERMRYLDVLILDEADQLLDMGFRPAIERILQLLKHSVRSRQTLLFSATVPKSVKEIASLALKPKYSFVDTVGEDAEQTHSHVLQEIMVCSDETQLAAIAAILERETTTGQPFKIMVFFTTARYTGFAADFFRAAKTGYKIVDIHSRKSQTQRQKASDAFRDAERAVLFSSDVSARGMDYPNVTFVLQVGLTERTQYIHRLGRTARAGKEGKGALLVSDYEAIHMRKELKDMNLKKMQVPDASDETVKLVKRTLSEVSKDESLRISAGFAYKAFLGFYNSNLKKCGWDAGLLVKKANKWAKCVGLTEQPPIDKKTIGAMGLKGVPGLLIDTTDRVGDGSFRRRR
jgi:ATP-dependent RNA helicase MSS116, mitochondrial